MALFAPKQDFYMALSAPKQDFLQPAPPRGASGGVELSVTAWRASCLYGVTYSRASLRLPDEGTSSVLV